MGAIAFTGNALCQALMLEGVSRRTEANIESLLRRLWENNGPDFVLSYLKVLKKDTECSLVDPNYRYAHKDGEVSVAWDHRNHRPKGPLGCLYKQFPEASARVRVIGAVICSITFEEASPKQIQKFISGLRSDFRSTNKIQLSDLWLQRLEAALEKRVREVTAPFGCEHLTNNVLPYAHVARATAADKSAVALGSSRPSLRSSPRVRRAIGRLHIDKLGQFYTAPRICKTYWNRIIDQTYIGQESQVPKGIKFPRKVRPRPHMARDYEFNREYGRLFDDCAEYSAYNKTDYVGRLDFIQKPGGKLRSVANINRFVNYTMEPFAKALEDIYYRQKEIAVLDQKQGLRWAQKKLGEGERLTSLDLTSATDTLDFRVYTDCLKREFPNKKGILELYAEYFEKLSELPLYCEALDSAVQFKTGQPLGMKGSFQVLTAMNFHAGYRAEKLVHANSDRDGNFRVVGDDFVCKSQLANAYNSIIRSWGGQTNLEKAMESDRYAEFLSHLVTRHNVYVTKPKYRPSAKSLYANLEKAKVRNVGRIYHLTDTEKNAVRILSAYSVDEMDYRNMLPNFRTKSLDMDNYSLELMATALSVISEYRETGAEQLEISEDALEYLFLEDPTLVEEANEAPVVYTTVGGTKVVEGLAKGPEIHESVATMPTGLKKYDHRTGKDRDATSQRQAKAAMEAKAKEISQLHASLTGEGETGYIDLGFGRRAHSDDIMLAAMQAVEPDESSIPDRLIATSDAMKQRLIRHQDDASKALISSINCPYPAYMQSVLSLKWDEDTDEDTLNLI